MDDHDIRNFFSLFGSITYVLRTYCTRQRIAMVSPVHKVALGLSSLQSAASWGRQRAARRRPTTFQRYRRVDYTIGCVTKNGKSCEQDVIMNRGTCGLMIDSAAAPFFYEFMSVHLLRVSQSFYIRPLFFSSSYDILPMRFRKKGTGFDRRGRRRSGQTKRNTQRALSVERFPV